MGKESDNTIDVTIDASFGEKDTPKVRYNFATSGGGSYSVEQGIDSSSSGTATYTVPVENSDDILGIISVGFVEESLGDELVINGDFQIQNMGWVFDGS